MIRFPFSRPRPPGAGDDAAADAAAPPADPAEVAAAETARAGASDDETALEPAAAAAPEADVDAEADAPAVGEAAGIAPDMEEQTRMVEAMLFASEKPLSTAELASRMPIGCDAAVAVRRVEEAYAARGVRLARVAGKWAFRTAPDLAHLMSTEVVEERKLSRAALETLAIVAYHQPVTRAEIEEIRQVGVSKGTIDLLMELEWVKLGRRRQTPGRPVTFVTTEAFLEHFGLESVKDLPRLEELRQSGLLDSRPPIGFAPGAAEGAEDGEAEEDGDAFEPDGAMGEDEDPRRAEQDPLM